VKNNLLLFGLFTSVIIFMIGCDLNPESSHGTVEVNTNAYTNACVISANIDGGNTVTVPNGTIYTFPLVSPGNHILNFSVNGNCGAPACVWQNGSNVISCSFLAVKGTLSVAVITQNGSCNILSEACP
jgi:hypothetical protein